MKNKQKLTPEELSRIRSESGKKGAMARIAKGNNKGGRPKGAVNKLPSIAEPSVTMRVHKSAYQVFDKLASLSNITLVLFMDKVSAALKAKNPTIFSDETQVSI